MRKDGGDLSLWFTFDFIWCWGPRVFCVQALDDQLLSKDFHSVVALPHCDGIYYVCMCGLCVQKCPLPALVIGNPLTVNNDRHQGAKCPVQDSVGISPLTGGKQHLFGCLMQRWFISLSNSPHLKVAVILFRKGVEQLPWRPANVWCDHK